MRTSTQFPLLLLPDELIALIVEQVDDLKTLRSLTRTCHRVRGIAESKLYRTLLIRSGDATQVLKRAIASQPERAKAIRTLQCPLKSDRRQDYEALEHVLTVATGLNDFMFESPACNTTNFEDSDEWEYMARHLCSPFQKAACPISQGLPKRPLQQLRHVTLHLNGANSPYWTLDARGLSLFLHPTIQKLHISCMNVLDTLMEDIPANTVACTPLKNLILDECNICSGGLGALLSLPSALESFYFGENCHNIQHFKQPIPYLSNLLFWHQPVQTVNALKQQKHSLKFLTYLTGADSDGAPVYSSPSSEGNGLIDGGFSEFTSLEKVTLVGYCPAFERCLISMDSPPNLTHLAYKAKRPWYSHRIHSSEEEAKPISVIPFLRAPSACLPKSLKQLDVTHQDLRGVSIANFVRLRDSMTFVRDVHKAASEVGITLRVFATQADGPLRYYPPYLYTESEPMEILISSGGDPSPNCKDEGAARER